VQVLNIPLDEAPEEAVAYFGWAAVVIPAAGDFEKLNQGQRSALETYAALGGNLVLGQKPKGALNASLGPEGDFVLGHIFTHQKPEKILISTDIPVKPHGVFQEWERRQQPSVAPLLPQATAPLGTFFLIMVLFTLAIGPGSIAVAQARGQAALLISIPLTALVTCGVIMAYSLMADGFSVHTKHLGYTRISKMPEGERRAYSVSFSAWYANLAPPAVTLPHNTWPVEPEGNESGLSMVWGEGLKIPSFLASRTYQEWGMISAQPTRARIQVTQKGQGVWLENALGFDLSEVSVNIAGSVYQGRGVRDGQSSLLLLVPEVPISLGAESRFSQHLREQIEGPLKPNEFLARIESSGFLPSTGISATHHDSVNLVRGEVDR
jgi:hypothetical protein